MSPPLPLDDSHRPQPRHFPGDPGAIDDIDDVIDVLVGGGLFLGEPLEAAGAGDDAEGVELRSIRRPAASFTAAVRLISRPAPWQVVPNDWTMLPG